MAYAATRGGEAAIGEAERLFREDLPSLTAERVAMVRRTLPYLVDRAMGEASLYEPDLAALAIAQAGGDLYEAVLLLRAYRTTQPRLWTAEAVRHSDIFTVRRISAAFKDIPGGQILGPTLDYSHRLLKVGVLSGETEAADPVTPRPVPAPPTQPALVDWQREHGLVADTRAESVPLDEIPDVTRDGLLFPAPRAHRLQTLARGDTGGMLALGYANMRGYGPTHPTVNDLRLGEAEVRLRHPRGTVFSAGRVRVSEAEMVSKAASGGTLELGFCATFGWNEVKTIAGATLDLSMHFESDYPAASEEFVLYHTEPTEASGFCIHFKMPHYVTFQSSLDALRGANTDRPAKGRAGDAAPDPAKAVEEIVS
ncbi:carbon-phosphorus lyase complex subunit PhnI [Acuticoccus sp. M5D2P5]|uniref:carbon-phosphorus lyase complex subunit PhnI n=1 Tax=Acuticoccus kalidii TaxID=2910977 RepID=UPI001F238F08|nr:carbon-phosphorus lyase complex subunit PhnI [Acuticoccus kalidii]MCF3936624.1 carbon-phosphorus lyase complex subunit PhnI [Acuticoccus kalidii]